MVLDEAKELNPRDFPPPKVVCDPLKEVVDELPNVLANPFPNGFTDGSFPNDRGFSGEVSGLLSSSSASSSLPFAFVFVGEMSSFAFNPILLTLSVKFELFSWGFGIFGQSGGLWGSVNERVALELIYIEFKHL